MSTWLKIHRSLTEWEWYNDANTFRVFMHLLLTANYKETRYRGEMVPAGACVTGRKELSKKLTLSEQKIRSAINHLNNREITIKKLPKFSIISIVNWEKYQGINQQNNHGSTSEITSNQPATNQQLTTSKEYKKERRIEPKKESSICSFPDFEKWWESFPKQRRGSKPKAKAAFVNALARGAGVDEIQNGTDSYARSEEVAKGFAKGAAAWLNDDRWTNDYETKHTKGNQNGQPKLSNYEKTQNAAAEALIELRRERDANLLADHSQSGQGGEIRLLLG